MVNKNSIHIILFGLFLLLVIINPLPSESFDDVYLKPKILVLLLVIMPSVLLYIYQHRDFRLFLRNAAVITLITWLIVILISMIYNYKSLESILGARDRLDGFPAHLIYIALCIAGILYSRDHDYEISSSYTAIFLVVGGSLVALTNILQQLNLMGVPGEGAFTGVSATPFGGTLGNRGYMGGALALLLPLIIWHAQQRWVWWAGLGVTLVTWGWLGSVTRGAWLAGGLALLILVIRMRLSRNVWGCLLFGAILFGLMGNYRFFGDDAQAIGDSSGRGVLWKTAIVGIQERPLFGWGTPALYRVMAQRPSEELVAESNITEVRQIERLSSDDNAPASFLITHNNGEREKLTLNINKVHNEYLDYALTYGIPALLLFLAILGMAFCRALPLHPAFAASVLAYAVYLLTWPEVIRFAPLAWFIIGMSLGMRRPLESRSAQELEVDLEINRAD